MNGTVEVHSFEHWTGIGSAQLFGEHKWWESYRAR